LVTPGPSERAEPMVMLRDPVFLTGLLAGLALVVLELVVLTTAVFGFVTLGFVTLGLVVFLAMSVLMLASG